MNTTNESVLDEGNHGEAWGQHTLVDAHGCDMERLASLPANEDFAGKLCDALGLKTEGPLLLENFGGEVADGGDPRIFGPSFAQAIRKGLVQAHCPVHPRLACVDILKDGEFDSRAIDDLVREFFKAEYSQTMTMMRGVPNEVPEVRHVQDSNQPDVSWHQHIEGDSSLRSTAAMNNLFSAFIHNQSWGQFTCIDLHNCKPEITTDTEQVATFNEEICSHISAARYGDPILKDYGDNEETRGITFAQLIETSLVQGHFINGSRKAFVDLFSCKQFDSRNAAKYAADFFGAESYSTATVLRGAPKTFPVVYHNAISTRQGVNWVMQKDEK